MTVGTLVAAFVILYFSGAKSVKVFFFNWMAEGTEYLTGTQHKSVFSTLSSSLSVVQRPLWGLPSAPTLQYWYSPHFPLCWVESGVLHMNYADWDTIEQRNTSAIIIETIENTILVGSIIRLQVGESDPFFFLLSSRSFLCGERATHNSDSICCPDFTVSWVTLLFFILHVSSH